MKRRLGRPASVVLFVLIVAVFLIADRFTKALAVEHLSGGVSKPFIPQLIDFYLTFNEGAAYGILSGAGALFLVIAFLVSLAILLYLVITKRHGVLEVIALSLIVAGALGNAIDRVREGMVVDFIRLLFIDFPLFNIADSCITVGVILFIIFIILDSRASSRKNLESAGEVLPGEKDLDTGLVGEKDRNEVSAGEVLTGEKDSDE